eukprot:NODE_3787_length_1986_cov_4.259817.p1 GENE.NODE_3787_length_1986_cov_4.259817~~NODE_3787_length_1986_cov_4.259817.p1  ORF type:complete len:547 (-),score=115.88 NODE_3787_length_1986_cov_4.259817:346-1794(-)
MAAPSGVQRFPRLGSSVCRSLGLAPSPTLSSPRRLYSAPAPNVAPSFVRCGDGAAGPAVVPIVFGIAGDGGSIADAGAGAGVGRGGIVPRLGLGSIGGGPATTAACAVALAEAGRKRLRGVDISRSPRLGGGGGMPAQPATVPPALSHVEIKGPKPPLTDEQIASSYDPEHEENNYHIPNRLYRQWQLEQYRQVCSEVVSSAVYISGHQVACSRDCLRQHGITHVVNTAADVCENLFPSEFRYLTYYLKDINHEDMSLLFYRTIEWMQAAISAGGRVLVHCKEGVSRSATMVIAYLMWRFNMAFEVAHEKIRKVRPICNPNTGFTCQLLTLAKKLGIGTIGSTPDSSARLERPAVFRIASHHAKEPFLMLTPAKLPPAWPIFDPRFTWVLQSGNPQWCQLTVWIGTQVVDSEAAKAAVQDHIRWLEHFEKCRCTYRIEKEGMETIAFWQALGLQGPPSDSTSLAARCESYDADAEILKGLRQ